MFDVERFETLIKETEKMENPFKNLYLDFYSIIVDFQKQINDLRKSIEDIKNDTI